MRVEKIEEKEEPNEEKKKLKRRKTRRALSLIPKQSKVELANETFVNLAKDIVLMAQNDRKTMFVLKDRVAECEETDFQFKLRPLVEKSVAKVMQPFSNHVQEIEALYSSIALKQKYEKLVVKLREELAEIERSKVEKLEERSREREALENDLEAIRGYSRSVVEAHKEQVRSRVKGWWRSSSQFAV